MLGLAGEDPELTALFDGSPHGPQAVGDEETAPAALVPQWLEDELSPLVTQEEWPALLERAPLDLRANISRVSREALLATFDGAEPTGLSPWGLRLPADSRVDQHPAFLEGLVEVQDEGSQLIALACEARAGMRIVDLCAGAGGKALALAAAAPEAEILASDTNRARLSRLPPRAERAGAKIDMRLLDGGREAEQLADWDGKARVVGNEHPCTKPTRLFEIPMEQHTKPGAVVLEPFSGSGSQLIAAEKLRRRCRAIEIEPAFVDVALRRWEQATGNEAVLEGTGQSLAQVAEERGGQ